MNTLPTSIEESLKDAGFSATEILILRRLIEDRSLTLRQLAAKTGKSTGVLDQAMKKLLRRNVVTKDIINDNPVFTLVSLEAISRALEEDTEDKRASLKRRFENFESFVQSLEFEKSRPDTEYFEHEEGIKRCYCKLLGLGKEIIGYIPVQERDADDPMEAFSAEFFRERRRRSIFSRIIAHDTPAGRKYQSRDPFEYRKTLLMPEQECLFSFEKLIIGDSVVCINHKAERACIIHFPELAQTERALFETLWRQQSVIVAPSSLEEEATPSPMIPFKIRLFSELRDFFMEPKNVGLLALSVIASFGIAAGLYRYTTYINIQRVQDQARSVAATAALMFDAQNVEHVRDARDIQTAEYARLIYKLNEIRRQNPEVKYAYIFRKSDDPKALLFVADADSIDPFSKIDLNEDGVIDTADALSLPGEKYVLQESMAFADAFNGPVSDTGPYTDQWGTFISAAAPIRNEKGEAIAIIGVDILAERVEQLSSATGVFWGSFILTFLFLGIMILYPVLIKLVTKRVFLLNKIKRINILQAAVPIAIALALTALIFWKINQINLQKLQIQVLSIAKNASENFDVSDLRALQSADDYKKPEWQRVVNQLLDIRLKNRGVLFAYIYRENTEKSHLEFVADSHSINPFANLDADPSNDIDANNDGLLEPDGPDKLQWPGQDYPNPPESALEGLKHVEVSRSYEDAWGAVISGYSPIVDDKGVVQAVLAIDVDSKQISLLTNREIKPFYVFIVILLIQAPLLLAIKLK